MIRHINYKKSAFLKNISTKKKSRQFKRLFCIKQKLNVNLFFNLCGKIYHLSFVVKFYCGKIRHLII
ncbi:hypothetical protein AAJ76_82000406 [Vairimorpha ceranae]|uniref:Uncharacterized protein n=1 Tax=Vairimorpha ceranae TaxID=40302 RepID=A0A0F9W9H9_9MICR|nr:hypothetical protein AAJ76_82000406 [Vairimorpha ceranae]KKO74326.1 hypothetical protein AAJ76_82000406 [Vairimorpha ceranae]